MKEGGGGCHFREEGLQGFTDCPLEERGGLPAYGPPFSTVGGKRAPPPHAALAKARASLGGVFMKLPCPRGHAALPGEPSAITCCFFQGGGVCPCGASVLSPHC